MVVLDYKQCLLIDVVCFLLDLYSSHLVTSHISGLWQLGDVHWGREERINVLINKVHNCSCLY